MRFIYDLLSGCLVVMSTTGLLTERIKGWQYIALTMYVMAMAELSKITGLGQVIGLVMVLGVALEILMKTRTNLKEELKHSKTPTDYIEAEVVETKDTENTSK